MTSAPAELRTLRPYRQRFPVLRSIPTTRHASLLPSPWAISCTYRRCFSACTPPAGARRLLRIATSRNRSVLRRQLASAPSFLAGVLTPEDLRGLTPTVL